MAHTHSTLWPVNTLHCFLYPCYIVTYMMACTYCTLWPVTNYSTFWLWLLPYIVARPCTATLRPVPTHYTLYGHIMACTNPTLHPVLPHYSLYHPTLHRVLPHYGLYPPYITSCTATLWPVPTLHYTLYRHTMTNPILHPAPIDTMACTHPTLHTVLPHYDQPYITSCTATLQPVPTLHYTLYCHTTACTNPTLHPVLPHYGLYQPYITPCTATLPTLYYTLHPSTPRPVPTSWMAFLSLDFTL